MDEHNRNLTEQKEKLKGLVRRGSHRGTETPEGGYEAGKFAMVCAPDEGRARTLVRSDLTGTEVPTSMKILFGGAHS